MGIGGAAKPANNTKQAPAVCHKAVNNQKTDVLWLLIGKKLIFLQSYNCSAIGSLRVKHRAVSAVILQPRAAPWVMR